MKFFLAFAIVIFSTFSCKKPADRKCFKTVGAYSSDTLSFESFNKIRIFEHLNCVLIQDSMDQVVISGGKNLIEMVECKLDNGFLELKNLNQCNFLRNFKNDILIEIHFTELINLESFHSGQITNLDTLQLKWFAYNGLDGAGSCLLNLKAEFISVYIEHGHSDITLQGKVNNLAININNYGACNSKELAVRDSLIVVSNTVVPLFVNADLAHCKMQTKSSGNITYFGNPLSLNITNLDSGHVIEGH
jgi:hypothetical protein